MEITVMRQQLHNYLEEADDRKVKAFYTIVEDEIKNSVVEYSDEFKADLDLRVAYYLKGGKMVKPAEMNRRLQNIRKKSK